MNDVLERLKSHFPLGEQTRQRADMAFVTVDPAQLRAVLLHLRDLEGYTHLVLLTAVDWIEDGQLQLTYLLNNRLLARDIGLRVLLPRDGTVMTSIHDIWPTAETYQRELREMFGIDFPGSPRVSDNFALEGWVEVPPYRRDFDTLEYSRQNFRHRDGRETSDPAQHMKKKLYPDGV